MIKLNTLQERIDAVKQSIKATKRLGAKPDKNLVNDADYVEIATARLLGEKLY